MKLSSRPTATDLQRAIEEAMRLLQSGRPGPAARLLKDIAGHRADDFDVLHLLGAARVMDGRIEDGIRHLQEAARIRPEAAAVWVNLGGALEKAGRPGDAADAYARALEAKPDLADANHRLCLALMAAGRTEAAASRAEAFAARQAGSDGAHLTLGLVRLQQGRGDEAIDSLRTAVGLAPGNTLAAANLAFVLGSRHRYAEAVPLLAEVVARRPNDWPALEKLIHAKRALCDWGDLEPLQRRLIEAIRPERANVDPWTLFSITDRADILQRAAVSRTEATVPRLPPALRPAKPYAHARVRLGYLAGDFREHPVAHAMAGLIEAHDRQRFEVVAIAYGADDGSSIRARIAAGADRFVDLGHASPAAIAAKVRELEIDVAVDLSGPTEFGQPIAFSHRPAPVQVSFLGYPGTGGAPWLDYLIADAVTIPAAQDRYYAEHIVRLPDCYFPPMRRAVSPAMPSRADCGLPESGAVLASFNNSYKIGPDTFDVWMRILARAPGGVLWLRSAGETAEANLRAAAGLRGIAADRLVFAARLDDEAQHLARLRLADLFLDCSPYNAHTTACDALWAGVPVLTCPGQSFASRVAPSLVTAAGLTGTIVANMAAYEATALDLVRDPARLADLKARLIGGRDNCRLFDLDRYRGHLESAYFIMHERARKGLKHGPIAVGGS